MLVVAIEDVARDVSSVSVVGPVREDRKMRGRQRMKEKQKGGAVKVKRTNLWEKIIGMAPNMLGLLRSTEMAPHNGSGRRI